MMQRVTTMLGLVSMLMLPMGSASALSIDEALVERPESIQTSVLLGNRWRDLFAMTPQWVPRQVAYVSRHAGAARATMFAARLLYPPDRGPWVDDAMYDRPKWQVVDRDVRLAILREIRFDGDRDWLPVLQRMCMRFSDPILIQQVLETMHCLDAVAGADWALYMAVPVAEGYPAARSPELRVVALRKAVRARAWNHVDVVPAVTWALQRGTPGEVVAALHMLPQSGAEPVIAGVMPRIDRELRAGVPEMTSAAVAACQRLRSVDATTAATVAAWCLSDQREVLCAAANAVCRSGSATLRQAVAVPEIERRLHTTRDPATIAALATLMLHIRPQWMTDAAQREQSQFDPWRRLAEHRQAMDAWENPARY